MWMRIKMDELVTFSAGTNISRLKEDVPLYSIDDFEDDFKTSYEYQENDNALSDIKDNVLRKGDVIFSVMRNKVGIVSEKNEGKFMTSNFVKCQFDKGKLYPWYFCYLINESTSITQQIKKMQQGILTSINRLTISSIKDLEFELEEYEMQKQIGELYRNILIREKLALKQIECMKQITLEIIKKIEKN